MKYEKILIGILVALLLTSTIFTGIGWYSRNRYMDRYRQLTEQLRAAERNAAEETRDIAERINECTAIAAEIRDGFSRQANTIRELRDAIQTAREKFREMEDRLRDISSRLSNYNSDYFNSDYIEVK